MDTATKGNGSIENTGAVSAGTNITQNYLDQ
jgi:hypothetical protein